MRDHPRRLVLTALGLGVWMLTGSVGAFAMAAFEARVVGVVDGDTVDVLRADRHTERVRLQGIDAPERGQPYGTRAKQALADLVVGHPMTVLPTGRDRARRLLADLQLPDGWSTRAKLVRVGMAWLFRKYSQDAALAALEAEARAARRGLWADPRPVPRWEWRNGLGRVTRPTPLPSATP
jgi:endonuclease YncB( thermonuclease family)